MTTFKFWGVMDNGERDLIGMVSAQSVYFAMLCLPYAVSDTLREYGRIEIERDGFDVNMVVPR